MKLFIGLLIAALLSLVAVHAQISVALSRLDCLNQPSTRLLVNDSAEWTTYSYDASMLLNEDDDKKVYVVQVAPHARLIICVG